MAVRAFAKCVYLVFKSYGASILQSNNMKYQRHSYFGLRQIEREMVHGPFKDVATARTTTFNLHQLCTLPKRCVCFFTLFSKQTTAILLHSVSFILQRINTRPADLRH